MRSKMRLLLSRRAAHTQCAEQKKYVAIKQFYFMHTQVLPKNVFPSRGLREMNATRYNALFALHTIHAPTHL